jgi:hypothetical protein
MKVLVNKNYLYENQYDRTMQLIEALRKKETIVCQPLQKRV